MAKQENIIEVEEPIKQEPVQVKSISRKYLLLGLVTLSIIFGVLLTTIQKEDYDAGEVYISTGHKLYQEGLLEEHFTACRLHAYQVEDKELAETCMNKAELLGVLKEPYTPYELFYAFKKSDNTYISQDRFEHANKNGLLADDIATGGRKLTLYAPDWKNEVVEWEAKQLNSPLKGNYIQLTNGIKRFEIGHADLTVGEGTVATGNTLGVVKCPGEENVGVSTGCHIHFSYLVNDGSTWNQTDYKVDKNFNADKSLEEKTEKQKSLKKDGLVYFTTYNAEPIQTDGSPCQGAWGNVCELYKEGKNPIALDRGQIYGNPDNGYCNKDCPFSYGDTVLVTPIEHWQTPFEAIVADTMNNRYTGKMRGDLFKDDKSKNTSFTAYIKKINK